MVSAADKPTQVLDALTGAEGSVIRVECVGESDYYEGTLVDRVVWGDEFHAVVLDRANDDTGSTNRCTLFVSAIKAITVVRSADAAA